MHAIKLVAIAKRHICAVTENSLQNISCWGLYDIRLKVPDMFLNASITSMAASALSVCAGNVNLIGCWGDNFFGETDFPAEFLLGINNLSAGTYFFCGISYN